MRAMEHGGGRVWSTVEIIIALCAEMIRRAGTTPDCGGNGAFGLLSRPTSGRIIGIGINTHLGPAEVKEA